MSQRESIIKGDLDDIYSAYSSIQATLLLEQAAAVVLTHARATTEEGFLTAARECWRLQLKQVQRTVDLVSMQRFDQVADVPGAPVSQNPSAETTSVRSAGDLAGSESRTSEVMSTMSTPTEANAEGSSVLSTVDGELTKPA